MLKSGQLDTVSCVSMASTSNTGSNTNEKQLKPYDFEPKDDTSNTSGSESDSSDDEMYENLFPCTNPCPCQN